MVSRKKIGSAKLPKAKKKKPKKKKPKKVEKVRFVHLLEDKCEKKELEELRKSDAVKNKIIADAHIEQLNFSRKVIEDDIDEAKEEFLQDIDNVFDPVKRKELAEKLDMHDEELMDNLRSISARKENQRLVEESGNCHLHPDNNPVPRTSTLELLELEQFYDESVNQYSRVLVEVEEKVSPPSEAEDLATTLALTTDIYADAKDGTINVEKLTKLIASQPELLNRGGVEEKLDKLLELVTNQQTVAEDLGSITDAVPPSPDSVNVGLPDNLVSALIAVPYNSGRGEAVKEELDKANGKTAKLEKELGDDPQVLQENAELKKEVAEKNKIIANMFAERKRKKHRELEGNDPVTNFINLVGLKVYKSYCRETLKKVKKVCGTTRLEEFHENKTYTTRIDESVGFHQADGVNIKKPKTNYGSTWRGIQTDVFKELKIKKGGKSKKRKGRSGVSLE